MECIREVFPVILYVLFAILLKALIALVIKAFKTLTKVNDTIDDINEKSRKLNNLFTVIDNTTDFISNFSDKALGLFTNGITALIDKFKKKKGEDE